MRHLIRNFDDDEDDDNDDDGDRGIGIWVRCNQVSRSCYNRVGLASPVKPVDLEISERKGYIRQTET